MKKQSLRIQYPVEYRAWKAMKARCYCSCNKNDGGYQSKGIVVCDRWKQSFNNFFEDMGSKPSIKHSLDRIDNDADYCKDNCRWTTWDVQAKNRGNFCKVFTHNGESMVLKDWSRKLGIKYTTLYLRIFRTGLSFEEAIQKDPFKRIIAINGESMILSEWCKRLDLKYQTIVNRIHDGMTPVNALSIPTLSRYGE